jgi:hypothetical protein
MMSEKFKTANVQEQTSVPGNIGDPQTKQLATAM